MIDVNSLPPLNSPLGSPNTDPLAAANSPVLAGFKETPEIKNENDTHRAFKYLIGASALATAGGTYWLTRPYKDDPKITNGDMLKAKTLLKTADIRLSTRKKADADVAGTAGTGKLYRVAIPVQLLKERELLALGFIPSMVAVPEKGQTWAVTFRQPKSNLHVHRHQKHWFVHKDKHTPLNVSVHEQNINPGSVVTGVKHFVTEGIPGMASYLKNFILGGETFEDSYKKTQADSVN